MKEYGPLACGIGSDQDASGTDYIYRTTEVSQEIYFSLCLRSMLAWHRDKLYNM